MSALEGPQPVKLFAGVIFAGRDHPEPLQAELERRLGRIESRSVLFSFDVTDYYRDEMGTGLKRVFYSFRELMDPGKIIEVKLAANEIERAFASRGKRRVNIDPGYMDFYKIVLVSGKFMGQKIYLGKGVYADPTLYYDKGWKPYDWGFPDFKVGTYNEFFSQMRRAYKAGMRESEHQQRGR
jgi:hypothetical protein